MAEAASSHERVALELAQADPKANTAIIAELRLEGLREHEGFLYLRDRVEDYRQGAIEGIARRLFAGQEIDPEELAFMRGFFLGAKTVLDKPFVAAADLEREARRVFRLAEEFITDKEDEQPYA